MKIKTSDKIILVGGHMTPALAVAEELQQQGFHNLSWIGTRGTQTGDHNDSAEYIVCTSKGIDFHNFEAGKLWRKWTPATFFKGLYNLFLIPSGFTKALILIWKLKPKLVIAFGGYLALPIIVMAKFARVKTVIHEQTTVLGLANKLSAKYADVILLSFPETLKELPEKFRARAKITGNPLPRSISQRNKTEISFPEKLPLLFVTGGNQGANTINWRLFKILPELLKKVNIVHQVGNSSLTKDLEKAKQAKEALPKDLQQRYQYFPYLFDKDFSAMMQQANLVLSRAGANTICFELALGKLAVTIPIPWSEGDEQTKNAKLLAETGLGLILKQYDAMPPEELLTALELGLKAVASKEDFRGNSIESAKRLAEKKNSRDAAAQIVETVLS